MALSCGAALADEAPSQDSFISGLRGIEDAVRAPAQGLRLRKEAEPALPALGEEPETIEIERRGEAYFIYGGGHATEGGSINGPHLQLGVKEHLGRYFSLGAAHLNEGHADQNGAHNHRDGFALMAWRDTPVSERAEIQFGAGPYFSMNTAYIDGSQRDDKHWGLLAAAALVYRLNDAGLGLRAQVNYVKMPATFDTMTVMLGVSQELGGDDGRQSPRLGDDGGARTQIGVWMGSAVTNRTGQQGHAGYQLEVERAIDQALHYSISVIDEGNSGLTNRAGVAAQAWYLAPPQGKWTFSAGAGPYVAHESHPGDAGMKLLGVISFRAERDMGRGLKFAARFSRIVSGYDKDEDLFQLGIEQELR